MFTSCQLSFVVSLTLLALLIGKSAQGQNLVPDPGFELIINCPTGLSDWANMQYWDNAVPTADTYHSCRALYNNSVPPRNGNGYAGLSVYRGTWTNYREYPGSFLMDTLQAGVDYYVEFWALLAPGKCWASNSLGAYLGVGPITSTQPQPLPYTPQIINPVNDTMDDQVNWMKVSGTFTALGGENYIVIGGFRDDASSNFALTNCGTTFYGVHWSYYLIDDVLVEVSSFQFLPSFSVSDTSICAGSCIDFQYTGSIADSLKWIFNGAFPSMDTSSSPGNICYASGGQFEIMLTAFLNGDSVSIIDTIDVLSATAAQAICVWEGDEDDNWFNSCNWQNNSVPDLSSQVIVPGGTPYNPHIRQNSAYCKDITILYSNGAELEIDVSQNGFLLKNP